jgi:hypothetical protein
MCSGFILQRYGYLRDIKRKDKSYIIRLSDMPSMRREVNIITKNEYAIYTIR